MPSAPMLSAPGVVAPLLPSGRLVMKYLFGAHFANGDEYFQTEDDESPFTPGKNAYYELLQCGKDGQPLQHPDSGRLLVREDIQLFQMEGEGSRYLVDLRDGHFEICASSSKGKFPDRMAPFFVQIPPPNQSLHLLYFRRRRHHTKVNALVREDLTVEETGMEDGGQECEYHFGWITADGKQQATLILV